MAHIDPSFPLLVLALCVFRKEQYAAEALPVLARFKLKHWGHDRVVLHERDLRKRVGPFVFIRNEAEERELMAELGMMVAALPFTVIAAVIRKDRLTRDGGRFAGEDPYHLALRFLLERLHRHVSAEGNYEREVHVVVESRGREEDTALELAFRRVCDGDNVRGVRLPFSVVCATKGENVPGLQVADLVARPIGRHCMRPDQPNLAFDAIRPKLRRDGNGGIEGRGLKIFP